MTARSTCTRSHSTPDDNTRAFLEGLSGLGAASGFASEDVTSINHGTTVALNAVLQKKWLPIGLLVTQGYREIIEIARQTVPGDWGAIYTWVKPPRVVPLENVREVNERLTYEGETLEPLDEGSVRDQAAWFKEHGIDSVAVCFLHSYADPSHEQRARELINEVHPECFVSISSDVLPEFREYERAMTTCLDAVLMPLVSGYLDELTGRLDADGYSSSLMMMKSMGGLSRHDKVVHQPITIAYSGPSAGVLGMAWLAEKIGEQKVLTYDMGGTSTDVALVEDGRPVLTTDSLLDIYPMKTPTIDLVSIGAGGGSIATLGTGNRLRVGPESAGAVPGPACYGRGGELPTVTDANLVLGRIPASLLSGSLELDAEASSAAIGGIAEQLNLSLEEAAYGILEIAAFNMAGAVREVSVKRGRDPRGYALFAYGGAGPLHAAQLASLLGIAKIPFQFCLGAQMTRALHPQFILDHLVIFPQQKPPFDGLQFFKPRRGHIRQAVGVRRAGGEEEDSQHGADQQGQPDNSSGDPFAIHLIVSGFGFSFSVGAAPFRSQRDLTLLAHRFRHRFLLFNSLAWVFVKFLSSFVEYTFPRGLSIRRLFPKSSCKSLSFE